MEIKISGEGVVLMRVAETPTSTLGHLYIDGKFECYTLEDKRRTQKIAGQTAIPAGKYTLGVNREGAMNIRYSKRFPSIHKGMVEIKGIPNFSFVYLHIGNYIKDTKGCPLLGSIVSFGAGSFQVMNSTATYERLYPILLKKAIEEQDIYVIDLI